MKGEKIMKKGYQFIVLSALIVFFSACDFLHRDPYGSTITQEQYEQLSNKLEGSMRGIYSMMYSVSDHDEFGKRSIDMYTDLMCGDMALTNYTYGWFYTDEASQGRTGRTGYIWTYYYGILHNVNAVIYAALGGDAASADNPIKRAQSLGLPTDHKTVNGSEVFYTINKIDSVTFDTVATFTETDAALVICYAQALTMRGYIYSNLLMLYCRETQSIDNINTELCFPLYTENNMDEAQGLAKMGEVYTQLESDLTQAIDYFEAFDCSATERDETKKLQVNAPVACGILAYSYLNKGNPKGNPNGDAYKNAYGNALNYATAAILTTKATILRNSEVTTTGFNDVNNPSWMWGQKVTVETAGGLASWFGQCDIHSYSYAWAGDTKAIDENLFNLIPDFDIRQLWFNDGSKNKTYKLCPDGKFFSAASPYSTKSDDIDREWLSDNVFMRVEAMYLIAAEASYRLGNDADALMYLTAITDERVMPGLSAEYDTWKNGLTHTDIFRAIEYNWRVEMWGEGYGLQTFKRIGAEAIQLDELNKKERHRGANHCSDPGSKIEPGEQYTFQMPSAEGSYNPKVSGTTLP